MKKRVISFILTLVMCLTLVPVQTVAAEQEGPPADTVVEEISVQITDAGAPEPELTGRKTAAVLTAQEPAASLCYVLAIQNAEGGYVPMEKGQALNLRVPEAGELKRRLAVCSFAKGADGQPDTTTFMPVSVQWDSIRGDPGLYTQAWGDNTCEIVLKPNVQSKTANIKATRSLSGGNTEDFKLTVNLLRGEEQPAAPELSYVMEPENPNPGNLVLSMTGGYWASMEDQVYAGDDGADKFDIWLLQLGYPGIFYVDPSGPVKHEITLYSHVDLLPENLTVEGGTAGPFERLQIGSHDPAYQGNGRPGEPLYLFRSVVEFPADAGLLTFLNEGQPLCRVAIGTARFYTKPYVALAEVRELRSDGTYLMRISGANLPETAEAYTVGDAGSPVLRGTSLTKNAELGCLDVVMTTTEVPLHPWCTMLINGEPAVYGGISNRIDGWIPDPTVGIPSIKALSGSSGGASAPSVIAKRPAVLEPQAVFTVRAPAFTEMQYSVNGDTPSDWLPVPDGELTIFLPKNQFGAYTIHFVFRNAGGGTAEVKQTIRYQTEEPAPAPTVFGVVNSDGTEVATNSNGGAILYAGQHYTFYAQYDPDYTLAAVPERADGTALEALSMTWNEAAGRYEAHRDGAVLEGAASMRFYADQDDAHINPGLKSAELKLAPVGALVCEDYSEPQMERRWTGENYCIRPGTNMTCQFNGPASGEVVGCAEITYRVGQEEKTCRSPEVSGETGLYLCQLTLPEGATALTSAQYFLKDSSGKETNVTEVMPLGYQVTAPVTLTGFPKSYEGAVVYLNVGAFDARSYVTASGEAFFDNLPVGEALFSVGGDFCGIVSRKQLTVSGPTADVSGLGLPALGDLTVSLQLPEGETVRDAEVNFRYRRPGDTEWNLKWDMGPGLYRQIPVGMQVEVTIPDYKLGNLGNDFIRQAKPVSLTVQEGNNAMPLSFDWFAARSLTGTVKNTLGVPLAGISVQLSQSAQDETDIYHRLRRTVITDENGSFTIEKIYNDYPAELTFSGGNYVQQTVTSPAGEKAITVPAMKYRTGGRVITHLMVHENVSGEAGGAVTEGNSALLLPQSVQINGKNTWAFSREVTPGGMYFFFNDENAIKDGDQITVEFAQLEEDSGLVVREADLTVSGTVGSSGNVELTVDAWHPGEIWVEAAAGGSGETGYAVLYDTRYHMSVLEQRTGTGMLRFENLKPGTYTLRTFREGPENAGMIPTILNSSQVELYGEQASHPEMVVKSVTVQLGRITIVEEKPQKPVGADLLKPFLVTWQLEDVPAALQDEAGLLKRLHVTVTPRDPMGPELLKKIDLGAPFLNETALSDLTATTGEVKGNSVVFGEDSQIRSCQISCLLKAPANTRRVECNAEVKYHSGWETESRSKISISAQGKVDSFYLSAPETFRDYAQKGRVPVTLAMNLSRLPDYKLNPEECTVTLYDNGKPVDTVLVTEPVFRYKMLFSDTRSANRHEIYAERKLNGEIVRSNRVTVDVEQFNDGVYVGDLTWIHRNDQGLQTWNFADPGETEGVVFRYYPKYPSKFSFRIYNATAEQLSHVRFRVNRPPAVLLYSATGTAFSIDQEQSAKDNATPYYLWETELVDSGLTAWGLPYTEWKVLNRGEDCLDWKKYDESTKKIVMQHDASPVNFSHHIGEGWPYFVEDQYDLPLGISLYGIGVEYEFDPQGSVSGLQTAAGGASTDWDAMETELAGMTDAQKRELAKSSLPGFLADDLDKLDCTQTDNGSKISLKAGQTVEGLTKFDVSVEEDPAPVYERDVITQMAQERAAKYGDGVTPLPGSAADVSWITYESKQGTVYVRQVLTEVQKPDGTTSLHCEEETFIPAKTSGASLQAAKKEEDRLETGMNRLKVWGEISGAHKDVQDWARITKNYDLNDCGLGAGEVGKKLNAGFAAVEFASNMYEMAKGPSTKDPAQLIELIGNIRDDNMRNALLREVEDYRSFRNNTHMTKTLTNTGIGVAGCNIPAAVPLTFKAAFFVGSKVKGGIDKKTENYINQTYDSLLLSTYQDLVRDQIKYSKEQMAAYDAYEAKLRRDLADFYKGYPELMESTIQYRLRAKFGANFKMNLRLKLKSMRLYIDPSGYVFEGVEDDRVPGVTATILQGNGGLLEPSTEYTPWTDTNPDETERQPNPMITSSGEGDEAGRYGWMTPYGSWKVRFTDEAGRYRTTETKAMTVPPEHTKVNIGLLANGAPAVTEVVPYQNAFGIRFDKWMQLEALADPNTRAGDPASGTDIYPASSSMVTVLDEEHKIVPGIITFPDKEKNTGYKDGPYQTDVIASDWFVKEMVFQPLLPFQAGKTYTVQVSKNALSYAGVPMAADYAEDATAENTTPRPSRGRTVLLNPCGGTVGVQVLTTGGDGRLSKLPEPFRPGYRFDGWFTQLEGGKKVSLSTVFAADTPLYARWTALKDVIPDWRIESVSHSELEDGKLVSVQLVNTGAQGKVVLFAAGYQNGRMIAMASEEKSGGRGTLETELTLPDPNGVITDIRVFLTDETHIPLTAAKESRPLRR